MGLDALQPVLITPAQVGLGPVPVVNETKPFLMLLESTEVRPVIESTKTPHIPLVIAPPVR
jgi:hypothetical protein